MLHVVAGESAGIVEREPVGLLFEPENAPALGAGVQRLAQDAVLYQRQRDNCLTATPRYDRAALAKQMLGVLAAGAAKA